MFGLQLLDVVSGRLVPLYPDKDGRLLADPNTGSGPPVAVISIPKAGTYLVGRLLEEAGYVSSRLHVAQTYASDYRERKAERGPTGETTISFPIQTTASLVGPGQFLVGHLPRNDVTVPALRSFKKIFVKREIAACSVSALRFMIDKQIAVGLSWMDLPTGPAQMLGFLKSVGTEFITGNCELVVPWIDDPSVFTLSFEALMGDDGEAVRRELLTRLGGFLELEGVDLNALLLTKVIGQPTLTLSSGRTDLSRYWSDEVRTAMITLGLNTLNARLGYPAV